MFTPIIFTRNHATILSTYLHNIFTCNGNKEKSVKCVIFCGNRND